MQMQDRVGQQFGNYRLKRLIGQGGYAEVYLAEHVFLPNRQYAIKVLTGTDLRDEKQDEFLLEARTIANLQSINDHIVQIHDFGIQLAPGKDADSGTPYIVMEYAAEGTLRGLYPQDVAVPLERIVFYVSQVAAALQCAHDQSPPIVHRDVKPENMLLRSIDHVLLSDFGIAVTGKTGPLTVPLKGGGVVGTAAYMAPERLSGHMRRASDQYSLGIVVYEWLCGSRPFEGTSKEICYKQLTVKPPPLYPTYPQVTQEIEDVVMRALEKKPEDRYPTVQAFAQALELAVELATQPKQQKTLPASRIEDLQTVITLQTQDQQKKQQKNTLHHNFIDVTEPFTQQKRNATGAFAAQQTTSSLTKVRDYFEFSSQFARDRRFSFFRSFGYVVNILSAIAMGVLLQNLYILFAGPLFLTLMFALCIRAVEGVLALLFGMTIALYWGWVGWALGNYSAPLLHYNTRLVAALGGLVFLVVSVALHIWYISRKNW